MANAPLSERDGVDKEVIWPCGEEECFCKQGWTGQIGLKRFDKFEFWRE
jgi:hypothetical protein